MDRRYQIIVEGVARVGKSVLIRAWLEAHPEYRLVKPERGTTANQFYDYMNQLQLERRPTIHDRSHISEQVYAPIYRRDSCNAMYPAVLNRLEKGTYRLPTVVVYLEPHPLMGEDEKANPDKDPAKELTIFSAILGFTHLPIIRFSAYDWETRAWKTPSDCVAELEALIEQNIHLKADTFKV